MTYDDLMVQLRLLRADNLRLVNDLETEGAKIEALARENSELRKSLKALVSCMVAALHEAEGIASEEVYDKLAEAGIISKEKYDPENEAHRKALRRDDDEKSEELDSLMIGHEIWILTPLGKEMVRL